MKFGLPVLATSCLLALAPAFTSADMIDISGSGTWDASAPTTEFSAPNESWSFSFTVPNPLDSNHTSSVTNGEYALGGSPVSAAITSVEFFSASEFGLFDIHFSDGGIVSLYGAQIYDPSTLELYPGTYAATIALNASNPPTGNGTGTVIVSSVPEPSSLLLCGVGLLGVVAHRRSKRVVWKRSA